MIVKWAKDKPIMEKSISKKYSNKLNIYDPQMQNKKEIHFTTSASNTYYNLSTNFEVGKL